MGLTPKLLHVSPLRAWEMIVGQLVMSIIRTLIGVGAACFFAWLLFTFSIFSMGSRMAQISPSPLDNPDMLRAAAQVLLPNFGWCWGSMPVSEA